jgi:diguanylate cyclase (GGDEF)-like protein
VRKGISGDPTDHTPNREQPWEDPSTARLRDRVESDMVYVRWILIGAGMLYLLFSSNVRSLPWGWGSILSWTAANIGIASWRGHRALPLRLSIVTQGVDTAAVHAYIAALQGDSAYHALFYSTLVVLATVRFGAWGTVGSIVIGIVIAAGRHAVLLLTGRSGLAAQMGQLPLVAVLAALAVNAALLGYYAYRIRVMRMDYWRQDAQLRKRISDITILHEVSSTVHDLNSEDALQNIVEIVTKVMGFQRAALFLADSVEEVIPHRYYSHRVPARGGRRHMIHMDPALFQEILQCEGPIVIDGSQGSQEVERGPNLQIAVPLHGDQRPIGVLVADSSDRWATSRSDMEMLGSLARSAEVAIENADLHHRLRQIANRDGLTSLYNHRYFQEKLREAIDASAGRWPISLLMIEIDKFKLYNDTFGHRRGDTVLFALSRALEAALPSEDALVARYGGDEFVVILPRAGAQEALAQTHRLREGIYALMAESLAEHNLPPVTLSIGIATYPVDAQTAGELIDAADQAMYAVKHDGGDAIRSYSAIEIAADTNR